MRKIWYIFSLVVIVPGLISLMLQGLNLGIDFTGGSMVEVRFERPVAIEEVRGVVSKLGLETDRGIQRSGDKDFIIRTREFTEEEEVNLVSSLREEVGDMEVLRNESVGPVISGELVRNALLALVISSLLILAYISVRFEFKQGIAIIIAIIHDVLVVMGFFSLLQLEINSAFIAAILTVVGYSINGSIIIFDRVRENLQTKKLGEKLGDLVNVSLWQTLARTINTVLTMIFVLVALLLLGGATIQIFVLAILIGIVSGAYSSICIASPIWVDMKFREKKAPGEPAGA